MVRVYTDGSCRRSLGGWAWWCEDTEEHSSGVEYPSTNQRMELFAAFDAVDTFFSESEELHVLSDSRYVVDAFRQSWYVNWLRNGWINRKGEPIRNTDIWKPLVVLVEKHHKVTFEWVPGHKGIKGNEKADELAVKAVIEYQIKHLDLPTKPLRLGPDTASIKNREKRENDKRKLEESRGDLSRSAGERASTPVERTEPGAA